MLEMARVLRNYGQRGLYNHEVVGLNSRLDEMQAAILRARLPLLARRTAARQSVAARYFDEIRNLNVRLLARPETPEEYVAHLFVVVVDDREDFMTFMDASGVDCLIHYPRALPDQPAAISWGSLGADVPIARRHSAGCVSLPCRPDMSDSDVDRIVSTVNGYRP
jgi:dTDP-4-amino-4,6-dideoxygalactose transaminase